MVDIIRAELQDGIAGYSSDGQRIYIEPSVPTWMLPAIIIHEETEMPLVLWEEMSYPDADEIATAAEKKACENLGISWERYDAKFRELMANLNPNAEDPRDIHEGEKHGNHIVEKFNHCHGPGGRFCSTSGGGGGGGSGGTATEGYAYQAEVDSALDSLEKDYPTLAKDTKVEVLKDFYTAEDEGIRELGNAYAAFYKDTIYINDSELSKPSIISTLKSEEANRWTSPGTGNIKGVVDHEFGHAIFDKLEDLGRKDGNISNDLYKVMDRVQKAPTSEYGKTTVFEGFAEGFAAMRAGKTPKNDAVKAITELTTKYRGVV